VNAETLAALGPFDRVLDVGGNVGAFAEGCRELWPAAVITSFEPVAPLATLNRERARGRWDVEQVAVSGSSGEATIRVCLNQPSASTMMQPGTVRAERFGIKDVFEPVRVQTRPLDFYSDRVGGGLLEAFTGHPAGRLLVKIDVEGHEGQVVAGGERVLRAAAVVIVECNQAPVFEGAPAPDRIDRALRRLGLYFGGVVGVQLDPAGEVVQFDGLWVR
jgi:FkbM family methyltransferase